MNFSSELGRTTTTMSDRMFDRLAVPTKLLASRAVKVVERAQVMMACLCGLMGRDPLSRVRGIRVFIEGEMKEEVSMRLRSFLNFSIFPGRRRKDLSLLLNSSTSRRLSKACVDSGLLWLWLSWRCSKIVENCSCTSLPAGKR